MRGILEAQGVPAGAIHPETASASTSENIRFAKGILDRLGIESVLIVSDAYHLPRARLLARRAGLDAATSAPPLRGVRIRTQVRGALREIPAYLAALLFRR